MLKAICLSAALAVTACNPLPAEPEVQWVKVGETATELDKATYECERDARAVTPTFGRGPAATDNAQEFIKRCMRAHGWQLGYIYTRR